MIEMMKFVGMRIKTLLLLMPLIFITTASFTWLTKEESGEGTKQNKTVFGSYEDARIFFNAISDSSMTVDDYGFFVVDKGSASAGRASCNIRQVEFTSHRDRGHTYLVIRCKGRDCISDPSYPNSQFKKATIDLGKGRYADKILDTLNQMYRLLNNVEEVEDGKTIILKFTR